MSKISTLFPRDGPPPIQEIMGPFFLGIILDYFLWGIQITQSYYYYKTYRKTDNLWSKLVVFLLFVVDGFQTICASQMGWNFLVDKWGDFNGITAFPNFGVTMIPFTDGLTASIVHVFYAHKIFVLLKTPFNYIFTGLVVLLSVIQLAAATGCTGVQFNIHLTIAGFDRVKTWVTVWLVTASLTDIVITVVMTWKLSKSRTGFQRTDDIISKLIRLTVETGLATAVVQIIDVVIFLIWPLKPFHTVPTTLAPKVYSNSVLAVLNSRQPRSSDQRLIHSSSGGASTVQTISIGNNYELQDNIKHGNQHSYSHHGQNASYDKPRLDV